MNESEKKLEIEKIKNLIAKTRETAKDSGKIVDAKLLKQLWQRVRLLRTKKV